METIQNQFKRIERLSDKVLNNINRDQHEYEDDVRQYFQECWNLKDRIKNDKNLGRTITNTIESEISNHPSLEIAADLANRMKHYSLDRHIRKDAAISRRSLTIHIQKPGQPGTGYGEIEYTVSIDTGETFELTDLVSSSLESWREVLNGYGIAF
ncbi:MAG: hypothetical protein PVG66_02180 [Chromatiales bacterium]|jgi:hypothetical protein